MLGPLKKLFAGYEDVSTVVAVGDSPAVALNRVEEAVRDFGLRVERDGSKLKLGGRARSEYLVVEVTEMDVGTRVELHGHVEPEIMDRVLHALSRSRPWTSAPSWD